MSILEAGAVERSEAVADRKFKPSKGGSSRKAAHWWIPWAFAAPGLALYALIIGYPLLRSLQISFYDWAVLPTDASTFIGIDNYTRALGDSEFWLSMVNAGAYLVLTVPITMALGLFFAVLLHAKMPGRTVFRVLFYIPVVTSWVVVSLLFKYLFTTDGGAVNWALTDLLPFNLEPIPWLQQRWTGMIAIAILGIWKSVGWCVVVFLAALGGVGEDQYEAAGLDGAHAGKKFWNVTVPGIKSTILFVMVLQVIGAFNVFISVILMTNGGPAGQTEVPMSYMYKTAFQFLDFGYAAAMSFILAVIIFAISFIQFKAFADSGDAK